MKIIKVNIKAKLNEEYSPSIKKGHPCSIDQIRADGCATGIMMRVIGTWKKPRWLDASWFSFSKGKGGKPK